MEPNVDRKRFRIEPLLGGGALLLLLIGCFYVLQPFMTALMWAIILAYSLHPLQRTFTRWFRGARTLAACLVTLTLTVVLAGPTVLIGFSLAQDGRDLAQATRNRVNAVPDQAPTWVEKLPLVGTEVAGYWSKIAEERKPMLEQLEKQVKTAPKAKIVTPPLNDGAPSVEPQPPNIEVVPDTVATDEKEKSLNFVALLGKLLAWAWDRLLAATLAVGQGLTQLILSGFLAFFLLRDAPILADRLSVAADRLAGERGRHLLKVAGDTVRGVIYGILGTAIAQALVAGLGFWIAGVPGAVLLSVLTFFFGVIPFGPPLIWLPAAGWLFAQGKPGLGIFMLIYGAFGISGVDNVIKPLLISQGSKMPFVLIFMGVIGGAFAFGLVGVFLGPTLLAVGFRLIEEWSSTPLDPERKLIIESTSMLRDEPLSATPTHGGESLGIR